MERNDKTAVLAIDGGGTGSRLALERAGGRVVIEAGPANVFTDFDAACANLTTGLHRLAGATGLSRRRNVRASRLRGPRRRDRRGDRPSCRRGPCACRRRASRTIGRQVWKVRSARATGLWRLWERVRSSR